MIDGKTLCTLSEKELEKELNVSSRLVRRRLLLEIDLLRAAGPPPPPPTVRRLTSEPPRGYQLEEVTQPLELQHIADHVTKSRREGKEGERREALEVVRCHRVVNEYLSYMLERTARQLVLPGGNRAVPPQGGYFHGTDRDACLSICEHGFDDKRWRGGKYGNGQYLSADASRASLDRYTRDSGMLLLVEACLGNVWHLKRGETMHGLNAERVRQESCDSLAVPETDEIVVYYRFQAVPRYVLHFRKLELPPLAPAAPPVWRAVAFNNGRFEQRLLSASQPQFARDGCTRAAAVEVQGGRFVRDVFLKLVADANVAAREADALQKVGKNVAPELITTFDLEIDGEEMGIVLVLEAALPHSSLVPLCRRNERCESHEHSSTVGESGGNGSEPSGSGGSGSSSLHLLAEAQRVLQIVARVHACGLVHNDIKPDHFMRFPGGGLRLVDFGSVQPDGQYCTPGHSLRYCSPEVAKARVQCSVNGRGDSPNVKVTTSIDVWAVGLVLYELFVGKCVFGEDVSYFDVACTSNINVNDCGLPEAHQRLLTAVLKREPKERPTASDLLDKHVFRRADDTAERRRVEIAAFFANPRGDLRLFREIQDLFSAFPTKRAPLVRPAARLNDIAALLATDVCPRLIAFSGHAFCGPGHEFGGFLLFEVDPNEPDVTESDVQSRRPREPSGDSMIRLLSPQVAPELRGLLLNACRTEPIANEIHRALPHLSVVCWRSIVHDTAAKVFSKGFYSAIAEKEEGVVSVSTAFDAGRAAFLRAGYREGNPEDYLHPPGHPHTQQRIPGWKQCPGCNPPVHGLPVLVSRAPPQQQHARARQQISRTSATYRGGEVVLS